jgi:hypothetical protein
MPKRKYKFRPKEDRFMGYIIKHLHDEDNTCLNIARSIYGHVIPLRNMNDQETRIQTLKDSPHVLKDEVYMKLEETLDALEHLCSEDENMERWNDGLGIISGYMYKVNYREMNKETYELLRKTTVEGLLAEIMTNRTKTNSLPC